MIQLPQFLVLKPSFGVHQHQHLKQSKLLDTALQNSTILYFLIFIGITSFSQCKQGNIN